MYHHRNLWYAKYKHRWSLTFTHAARFSFVLTFILQCYHDDVYTVRMFFTAVGNYCILLWIDRCWWILTLSSFALECDGADSLCNVFAPSGVASGALSRRYGCRPVIICGGLVASLSMIAASFSEVLWHLYISLSLTGMCIFSMKFCKLKCSFHLVISKSVTFSHYCSQ